MITVSHTDKGMYFSGPATSWAPFKLGDRVELELSVDKKKIFIKKCEYPSKYGTYTFRSSGSHGLNFIVTPHMVGFDLADGKYPINSPHDQPHLFAEGKARSVEKTGRKRRNGLTPVHTSDFASLERHLAAINKAVKEGLAEAVIERGRVQLVVKQRIG